MRGAAGSLLLVLLRPLMAAANGRAAHPLEAHAWVWLLPCLPPAAATQAADSAAAAADAAAPSGSSPAAPADSPDAVGPNTAVLAFLTDALLSAQRRPQVCSEHVQPAMACCVGSTVLGACFLVRGR